MVIPDISKLDESDFKILTKYFGEMRRSKGDDLVFVPKKKHIIKIKALRDLIIPLLRQIIEAYLAYNRPKKEAGTMGILILRKKDIIKLKASLLNLDIFLLPDSHFKKSTERVYKIIDKLY